MPGVFISYRREDTSGYAGRLFDILSAHFGRDNTFMDLDTIRGGDNFVTVIEDRIALCDVLLAVIGERWLTASHDGTRRLDQPEDFVRLEIAKALERGVRVIPVLVGNASVPREQDLPPDLRPLALRHALDLRDAHFREDAQKLIDLLDTAIPATSVSIPPPNVPSRNPLVPWLAGAAALVVITILVTTLHFRHPKTSAPALPTQSQPAPAPAPSTQSQPAPTTAAVTPAPSAVPHPRSAATLPANAPPNSPDTPSASAAQVAGTWKGTVTYDWENAVYPETFVFEVDGSELSGSASLFEGPRGILEGKIAGNRITFRTRTETELDDKSYYDKHNYKGIVTGDTIQFTMLTESDTGDHTPIHFTAHKLPAKK